jgi:hypothetical protein
MPVTKNLIKILGHESIEYAVGLILAYYKLLDLNGFVVYILFMQAYHLVFFEMVDKLWHRLRHDTHA